MSNTTSILVIGLDFDWAAVHLREPGNIPAIRATVEKNMTKFLAVPGLHSEILLLIPDDKNLFDDVVAKLRDSPMGKPWSAVIIGWGVRGAEDSTPLLEALVNLIKDTTPTTKFVFSGPSGVGFEAIRRNFPHLQPPA